MLSLNDTLLYLNILYESYIIQFLRYTSDKKSDSWLIRDTEMAVSLSAHDVARYTCVADYWE